MHAVQSGIEKKQVIPMGTEKEIKKWERLDDVIMGGQSESGLKLGEAGTAVWQGVLRVEGGGFCGARAKVRECVSLRV